MLTVIFNEIDFKEILNNANDIILTHIDGIINYINDEAARIMGYTKEELIGQPIIKFIVPQFLDEMKTAIERRVAGDAEQQIYTVRILDKNGLSIPVEVKSSLAKNIEGRNEFVIVARDITNRLKQEEQQRHLQDFLHVQLDLTIKISSTSDINQIFSDCLDSAIQVSNMDGGGIYLVHNDGSLELVASKGLSWQFTEQVHFYPANTEISEIARTGIPRYTEAMNTCPFFDEVTRNEGLLSTASLPIKNEGRVIACLNMASRRSGTISREAREFLEIITSNIGSAIARIEYENFKQQLLSNTTHELKTPLTSICGAADFLDLNVQDMDPIMARMISLIKRGSKRLQFLINNVLEFSRIDSEILTLHKETIDLGTLINEVIEDMQYMAMQKDISLSVRNLDELMIQADKFRIEQVLVNLISNAIKNTFNGGHVVVEGTFSNDYVRFSVKDDGVGITDEEIPLLFTKFGKVERKDIDVDIQGTGLGLFISRNIIEMHNGKIFVESEGRFKGSKFIVQLPKIG